MLEEGELSALPCIMQPVQEKCGWKQESHSLCPALTPTLLQGGRTFSAFLVKVPVGTRKRYENSLLLLLLQTFLPFCCAIFKLFEALIGFSDTQRLTTITFL